ncbi:MAG: hypothetical protein IT371_09070 [Deltaproteobacteria bacterium]|nr:hypothetical protein [Deltaproteobacteria bacterium]
MTLSELNLDERALMIGLFKLVIGTDQKLSGEESAALLRVADELGRAEFIEARQEAQARFTTTGSIRMATADLDRQAARELIYDRVFQVASTEGLQSREREELDWLGDTWELPRDRVTGARLVRDRR